MASENNRFNVMLDDEHAARLRDLATRVHLSPGTLARSLLSTALDNADPDPRTVTALLDSIPGSWDRVQAGLDDEAAGDVVPLDAL